MTRRVFGVSFADPSCEYDYLINTRPLDDFGATAILTLVLVPGLGAVWLLAPALYAYVNHADNTYGTAEMAWRTAVYGAVAQYTYAAVAIVWWAL